MKLIFAGTPEFAAQALSAIVAAGHEVALVLTQPDRPAGRGMALQPSAVKKVALAHGIEVFQPLTLKDAEAQAKIAAVGAEVMVVAAYGLILPQVVLDMPRFGCINIHASLLPRACRRSTWRCIATRCNPGSRRSQHLGLPVGCRRCTRCGLALNGGRTSTHWPRQSPLQQNRSARSVRRPPRTTRSSRSNPSPRGGSERRRLWRGMPQV